MTSYHHILTAHIQGNDDFTKQLVFKCFNCIVHYDDVRSKMEECPDIIRNCEIKQTNKTIQTMKGVNLKTFYIHHKLTSVHLDLVHHDYKEDINLSKTSQDNIVISNTSHIQDIPKNNLVFDFGVAFSPPDLCPKYSSLKEEMVLSSKLITTERYSHEMLKAQRMHHTAVNEHKELICKYFDNRYNIIRNERIAI
eukprot:11770_1